MIVVDELSVGYGSKVVVDNLSFKVERGQCVGLVGRSGCGKTTVLHAIAGLVALQKGSIFVEQREHSVGRIKGVVFQEVALLGWRTVLENVCFPGRQHDVRARKTEAERLLRNLGLSDYLNAYPYQLSTGMRRRVEFARALLLDDRYLIADEPFSALDIWTRQLIWKWFRELQIALGRITVLSTHSPEEALFLCDEIITLSHDQPSKVAKRISVPRKWSLDEVFARDNAELRQTFAAIVESLKES